MDAKENSALLSPSQSKPSLESMQNSATSTRSQTKEKKRERGECSSKTDDGDSGSDKIENILRSEVAKLTEKGCLVGSESVEKLVEFIQPNRMDKKLDLVSRSMVAGVIAATDWFDCLSYFVQLKGLAVLDEWLQDIHKGRIGGEVSSGVKDGEKSVEEFILVLLRALDKLPVNLHALQTCNIGRSVNRLRSHRNADIQRKARNLVDIWKKRVETEMNVLDAKSGSNQVASTWSSKSNLSEVHGNRNSIGSYDVSLKCSGTQDCGSNSKTVLNKASTEETTTKSICSSSGTNKETLGRNNSHEKLLPSSPSCEKTVVETSSNMLIVEIPNRIEPTHGSSPAQSVSGASFDDHSVISTSPVLSNIVESDHCSKDKSELYPNDLAPDANVETCHDNDQSKNIDGNSKASEKSQVPCSSLENDVKAVEQFLDSSTVALNTLIESCVKYSESNAPTTSAEDDVGMDLLARVATREMCASGVVSTFQEEKNCLHDDSNSKSSSGDNHVTDRCPMNSESEKQINTATGTESSLTEVKRSDVLSEAVNIKQQDEIAPSSLLAEAHHKSTSLNSDSQIEAKPTDGELAGPCLSDKKEGTEERISREVDGNCANGVFDKSGGKICERGETTAAKEEHCEDGDQQKSVRVKMIAKSEVVVTESCSSSSLVENESPLLKRQKLCVTEGDNKMEETKSTFADVSRMDFDLNEGFSGQDGKCGELEFSVGGSLSPLLKTPVSFGCITVVAAAAVKGPFVPPVDLLRIKGEPFGWKGSATTSAFRPVQPRKVTQMISARSDVPISEHSTSKPRLDFDLNVADERLLEDTGCQVSFYDNVKNHDNVRKKVNGPLLISHSGGGLDLDLNIVDDTNVVPPKSFLSSSLTTTEVKRDFDLNSGPGSDDVLVGEQSSLTQLYGGGTLSMNSLSPVFGVRPNGHEAINFSSWLPSSAVTPMAPQRISGPSSIGPFMPDMYCGSLLSPPSGPFPYQMFPFGTTLPLPCATYSVGSASPALNSQFLALPVSEISKKYTLGMHEGSNNSGIEKNNKWSRQSFNLNAAGPGVPQVQGREDFMAQRRQLYVSGSQPTGDSVLKRKGPEAGGLDREYFRYKQSSWH